MDEMIRTNKERERIFIEKKEPGLDQVVFQWSLSWSQHKRDQRYYRHPLGWIRQVIGREHKTRQKKEQNKSSSNSRKNRKQRKGTNTSNENFFHANFSILLWTSKWIKIVSRIFKLFVDLTTKAKAKTSGKCILILAKLR